MRATESENINNVFFDGYYKEIWRALIPGGLTIAEVDFLIEKADLKPGSRVLDLMCGYGRHTLALARKGMNVTAIDNLREYINEVKEGIQKEKLSANCIHADVIEYEPEGIFDLTICLGNNLSFFNEKDSRTLFSMIAAHTKNGGLFIANSWTLAEIVFKNFISKTWSQINGFRYLVENKFHFDPARIESDMTIIPADGPEESKHSIDYVYSLNEVQALLEYSAFSMREIWSIPGKKKFTLGEPRAYIVAAKK
jgi:SAM-dependent methyltransferase